RVISRPDRDGVIGGCDAILQRGTRRVAAEHTRIHSISERPKIPHIWNRIPPRLRERVEAAFPGERIFVWIALNELPRPKHWPAMVENIASVVIAAVPTIDVEDERKVDVPAFGIYVLVRRSRSSGCGICSVGWRVPGMTIDYAVEDMRRAIREKR